MRRSVRADVGALGIRILSAAVLGPVFLLAVYFGRPYADLVVVIGGGAMAFEWARLTAVRHLRMAEIAAVTAVAGAIAAYAFGWPTIAGAVLAAGALAVSGLQAGAGRAAAWLGFGAVYLGAACLAFLWLRARPDVGLLLVGWLILVVWSTDIGAYVVGRTVGGPRMAKRVSPKKTWAGLAGGVALAAALSALLAHWQPELAEVLGGGGAAAVAAAGAALAIVEQAGDLLESAVKRRAGVKDASGIIPGHGGVLDRCDGLLAASLALALPVAALQIGA